MNTKTYPQKPATSGINVVLGIWLIISPFALAFATNQAAEWSNIATGIAVMVIALWGASAWNVPLGLWVLISPLVLGFARFPTFLWNNLVVGALIAVLALASTAAHRTGSAGPPRV